jgi:hypothetical protein
MKKKDLWKYLKTKEGKQRFKEWSIKKGAENMAKWKVKYLKDEEKRSQVAVKAKS